MQPRIIHGDNLAALQALKDTGELFDLVELDGPYGAGLEDWDTLTEAEYLAHYSARLALVRDVLQPWGVVFMFGYPEWCAEVKAWAHRTETLYLRRWLTWYKKFTIHEGRRTETALMLWRDTPEQTLANIGTFLRQKRYAMRMSLRQVGQIAGRKWWHRGGNLYYENGNGGFPSRDDIHAIANTLLFDISRWPGVFDENVGGLTNIDVVRCDKWEGVTNLNDETLRSKPVQLYLDLFKPTIPPTDRRHALILYGGSGNAGIAAAALGYDVTICEQDPARCDLIRDRWPGELSRWRLKLSQLDMFEDGPEAKQLGLEMPATSGE